MIRALHVTVHFRVVPFFPELTSHPPPSSVAFVMEDFTADGTAAQIAGCQGDEDEVALYCPVRHRGFALATLGRMARAESWSAIGCTRPDGATPVAAWSPTLAGEKVAPQALAEAPGGFRRVARDDHGQVERSVGEGRGRGGGALRGGLPDPEARAAAGASACMDRFIMCCPASPMCNIVAATHLGLTEIFGA